MNQGKPCLLFFLCLDQASGLFPSCPGQVWRTFEMARNVTAAFYCSGVIPTLKKPHSYYLGVVPGPVYIVQHQSRLGQETNGDTTDRKEKLRQSRRENDQGKVFCILGIKRVALVFITKSLTVKYLHRWWISLYSYLSLIFLFRIPAWYCIVFSTFIQNIGFNRPSSALTGAWSWFIQSIYLPCFYCTDREGSDNASVKEIPNRIMLDCVNVCLCSHADCVYGYDVYMCVCVKLPLLACMSFSYKDTDSPSDKPHLHLQLQF